eukprot:SAG31_NODE_6114_length_2165_cov_1.826234_2_plen_294_part_00
MSTELAFDCMQQGEKRSGIDMRGICASSSTGRIPLTPEQAKSSAATVALTIIPCRQSQLAIAADPNHCDRTNAGGYTHAQTVAGGMVTNRQVTKQIGATGSAAAAANRAATIAATTAAGSDDFRVGAKQRADAARAAGNLQLAAAIMTQAGRMQGGGSKTKTGELKRQNRPGAKVGGDRTSVSNLQLECNGSIVNCPQTSVGMAKYLGSGIGLLQKKGIFDARNRSSTGLNSKWEYLKDSDPTYEPRRVTRMLDVSQKAEAEQLRGRCVRITCTMPERWGEPSQGNAKRARTK